MTATLLLSLATLLAADEPKEDAAKQDLAKLQGDWVLVSVERDGQKAPEELVKTFRRTVKGNKYTVTFENEEGTQTIEGVMTLDPSKKPKTVDVEMKEGPSKGQKIVGIYELEGDTHKICMAPPDGERPKDFASPEGERRTLLVWKRAKK